MRKCSKCGQDFEGEICPNCATADSEENTVSVKIKKKTVKKVYSLLYYLPALCLLFYAILVFALSALPVATVLGVSGGNMYGISFNMPSLNSGIVVTELKPLCLALFILAVCTIVYSIIAVGIKAIAKINNKIIGKVKLGDLLPYVGNVFYVCILVVCIVICAKVGELELGSIGACPITLMVFSVIFAAGSVLGLIFCRKLTSKYAALKDYNP